MIRTTIVGVFENTHDAQQAVQELRQVGFRDDQIGVMARDPERLAADVESEGGTHAGEGALAGVATGAGLGALWGFAIVAGFLPAIGPAIAGGLLGTVISSALAGAAAAGLAGALIGLGVPEEEAAYYEGEFKSGRTIVTVKADTRNEEAAAILRRFGAYDVDTRRMGLGETTTPASETGTHFRAGEHDAGEVPVRHEVHTAQTSIDVPVGRDELEQQPRRSTQFPE
jgi:hypothetical protein